ncbi:EthD domain-containing protein [Hypoxylon sp. NC0597]|nr:EthD domain-containing protein [Hypoxylon sp. NC0597]
MAQVPADKPLKYTITHYRKPGHTHEAFIKYIVEDHLPLALPVFKKHGIITYSLFVTPAILNDGLKQELGQMRPTWDFADFDCVIEFSIPDVQAIRNVLADPEWAAAVKDQEDWVDTSKALVSLGYSTPYLLETGEIVNLSK